MMNEIHDLLASAAAHREAGDGEKLIQVFRQLQLIQPEERNWQVAAACALGELGRVEETRVQLKAVTLTARETTMVAGALITGGAYDPAANLLRPILERDPLDVEAANKLASVLNQQGKQKEACDVLQKLLAQPIENKEAAARAWFNLGVSLIDSPKESEEAYYKSLELFPEYEKPVANLGLLLTKTGQLQKAISFLEPKVDARVDWPRTAVLLATACRLNDQRPKAIATLDEVVSSCEPETENMELAWEILVRSLVESENHDEAIEKCKQWKTQLPDSSIAAHMLAAVEGNEAPARASEGYVADTFDSFAESFDSVLTNLEYQAPQLIGKLVRESLGEPKSDLVVLDAGCGTGLAASFLKPFAKELVGVDLSAGMLAQAQGRGTYDSLLKADLVDHLRNCEKKYGLIAAADTFNYFGDLSELLPACFSALTDDGWLVFTLEIGETYGETWQLETHGRYTHPPGYLMEQLGKCGIEGGEMHTAPLRKENGVEVKGLLVAVQNPRQDAEVAD
jgi:predicted TPR repeat methyltransferase